MTFDSKAFLKANFSPREKDITISNPALSELFGGEIVWKVRGLTAAEISCAENIVSREKSLEDLIAALGDSETKRDELREVLGVSGTLSVAYKKRIEHLITASVEPKIDAQIALKLAENFPIEFLTLTNAIMELTGLGADLKK